MDNIVDFLTNPFNIKVVKTFLTLLIGYVFRGILIKFVHKKVQDVKVYYRIKRIMTYVYFSIIIVLLFMIWTQPKSFGTYFGLASAGIAIALKDLFINIAAWVFIMVKKPFDVGDRVEINGQAGDVIDQRLFQFTLMEIGNWVSNDQSTGRMIHMPNSLVFTYPLANFTSGFEYIWNEVHVLLTFESDYLKAKKMFLKIAENNSLHLTDDINKKIKSASKKYMISYNYLTPIVYTDVKDSGVMLSIRYLCKPHQRRSTIENIWEEILKIVEEHDDIDLAYSTVRMVRDFD